MINRYLYTDFVDMAQQKGWRLIDNVSDVEAYEAVGLATKDGCVTEIELWREHTLGQDGDMFLVLRSGLYVTVITIDAEEVY